MGRRVASEISFKSRCCVGCDWAINAVTLGRYYDNGLGHFVTAASASEGISVQMCRPNNITGFSLNVVEVFVLRLSFAGMFAMSRTISGSV